MRTLFSLTVAMVFTVAAAAGAPSTAAKKKTSPAKKTAVARPSSRAHGASAAARRAGSSASSRKRTTPARRASSSRARQLTPSPDRYKDIQQALATRGYLQPDQVTGVWDQDSMAALARFQAEQNLDATGKLNSLSLIALGLGPKHDALPTQVVAPDESGR